MEIQGPGSEKPAYQKEVVEGAQIFRESFEGYKKSKLPAQKLEYEKSMNEAMQAMQDAMQALMNKQMLKAKDQLAKDYQSYLSDPTEGNAKKVENDLTQIKKSA